MEKRRAGLTVIIPTRNEAGCLDRLLKLVAPWADEVMVCDSYSTDNTVAIAHMNNATVLQHEYINSALQKNWVIPQAAHPWVLIIDADELPEPALMKEIDDFLHHIPESIQMAYIPRRNTIWGALPGRGINYPDYQSRLFLRDYGRYQDKEVHAQVEVPGGHVHFTHALVHNDFKTISTWWLRNDRYFKYELKELLKRNRKWSFTLQYIKPFYVFSRVYLRNKLFLHGFKGFFIAFQWGVYHFFVAASLYEYEHHHNNIKS